MCSDLKEVRRLKHGEDNLIMNAKPLLLFIGSKDNSFPKCLVYGVVIEIVYTIYHEIVLTYLNVEYSNMLKESHEIYEASIVTIVQS